jgi:hypothetical protein
MKTASKVLLGLAMALVVGVLVRADDKKEDKEVTLKGTLGCSKCKFKVTDECGNAIKVKEGDKEVVYLFIDDGKKEKYHEDICTEFKKGSVTGVVSEKGGKKYIKPKKGGVKFD